MVILELRVYHPTTSTVVALNVPCENYTVTVRAENKAGASMNVTRTFTLVEIGECGVSTQCWCTVECPIVTKGKSAC